MPDHCRLRICLLIALWWGAELAAQAAQTDDHMALVECVLQDWRARRERSKSAEYDMTRSFLIVKGTRDGIPGSMRKGPIPLADVRCQSVHRWAIDFAQDLIWKETIEPRHVLPMAEFRPWQEVVIFDGTSLYRLHPRQWNHRWPAKDIKADVKIDESAHLQDLRYVHDFPIFYAHGIIGDDRGLGLKNGLPHVEFAVDDFSVRSVDLDELKQSPRTVTLRTKGIFPSADRITEYVVDLTRESAVIAASIHMGDKLSHRFDISHRQYNDDWWLPSHWRLTVLTEEQRLKYSMDVSVSSIAVNNRIDPSVFRPQLKPDYVVEKDGALFRVGADSRSLDPIRTIADRSAAAVRSVVLNSVVAGGVALVLGTVVILVRKMARTGTRGSLEHAGQN